MKEYTLKELQKLSLDHLDEITRDRDLVPETSIVVTNKEIDEMIQFLEEQIIIGQVLTKKLLNTIDWKHYIDFDKKEMEEREGFYELSFDKKYQDYTLIFHTKKQIIDMILQEQELYR